MEKLCKMARRIDWFMKALQILLVAFFALLVVFSGFGGTWTYRPGAGGFFSAYNADGAWISLSAPVGWLLFTVAMGVAQYILFVLRRILQPMKRGEPFATSVSADMRRLGFIVLIVGGALSLADAVGQAYTVERDLVLQMHRVDISFLVVSAIVFLFSYIFRYGEELQRQADETL